MAISTTFASVQILIWHCSILWTIVAERLGS